MIEARVQWDGRAAQDEVRFVLLASLTRAVVYLWTHLQQTLNVPNTGERRRRKRGKGSYTVYPNPSKAGEAPRKRTGFGQRNVRYSIDRAEGTGRVGVGANAAYMAYLETGTSRVAPRPWLLATLKRVMPQLTRIMFGEAGRG